MVIDWPFAVALGSHATTCTLYVSLLNVWNVNGNVTEDEPAATVTVSGGLPPDLFIRRALPARRALHLRTDVRFELLTEFAGDRDFIELDARER